MRVEAVDPQAAAGRVQRAVRVEQRRELDARPDVRRDGSVLGQAPQATLTTLELRQAVLELGDVGVELLRLGEGVEVLLRRLVGLLAQGLDRGVGVLDGICRGRAGPGASPGDGRGEPRAEEEGSRRERDEPAMGVLADGARLPREHPVLPPPRVRSCGGARPGGRRSVDVRSCGAATGGQDMALRWLAIGILGFMIGAAVMVFTDGGDDSASAETQASVAMAPATDQATGGTSGVVHDHTGDVVTGVKAQDIAAELEPDKPLDRLTRAQLAMQLAGAREEAMKYPTVADAMAAGMRVAGGFAPGAARTSSATAASAVRERSTSARSTRTSTTASAPTARSSG